MTVEERVEKVERQQAETKAELARAKRRVRRLLVAGAVGLACLVVLLAGWACMSETHAQQAGPVVVVEVQAQRFVLVDERGKPRAWLRMEQGGPMLRLSGSIQSDTPSARLHATEVDAGLILSGERGHGAQLMVYTMKGRPWGADKKGPSLILTDENGNVRAVLDVLKPEPSLALYDKKGNVIWKAPYRWHR